MAIDWDALYELTPSDTTYVKDTDDAIRSLKTATRERLTKEHEFDLASQARQGLHRAGSAVAFYQASAPTQRNGVALAAADAGLLFVDSDDKLAKVWDGDSFENMKAGDALTVGGAGLSTIGNGLKSIHGYIHGTTITEDNVFDGLAPALPNVNDWVPVTGSITFNPGGGAAALWLVPVSRAVRTSSTKITVYGMRYKMDGSQSQGEMDYVMTNGVTNKVGGASTGGYVSLAW